MGGQGQVRRGLLGEDVQRRARQAALLERRQQGGVVHHPATGAVDQHGAGLHPGQASGVDQVTGAVAQRQVQCLVYGFDGGPGDGGEGNDPVVDHDDIDHNDPNDDPTRDEDDSDYEDIDVEIIYDARREHPKKSTRKALKRAGITSLAFARSTGKAISHNKFIVLLHDGAPVAVWTGSTNITESGLYGQSNVGHVVRDPDVVEAYLDYWTQLRQDPSYADLRNWIENHTSDPSGAPALPLLASGQVEES